MTWRGTLLVALACLLALLALLFTSRARTRPADKPLLGVAPEAVEEITIQNGTSEILLTRTDGVWNLTKPAKDRADQALVGKILGAATSALPYDRLPPRELKGEVSLESLDLKPLKRSLTLKDKRSHLLKLGAEGAARERTYAQIDTDPAVYLISSDTASLAIRPLDDLRDPKPFAMASNRLDEIIIRRQGYGELTLRKQGKGWLLQTPLQAAADNKAVRELAQAILSAKIKQWMPAETDPSFCGLDKPEASLTLREEGGTPVTLEIGKETGDTSGNRYARCSDRSGIFILEKSPPWMNTLPSSLRSPHLTRVIPDSVDRIVIRGGASSLELSRKPGTGDWLFNGTTIPAAVVSAWFDKLEGITASGFETATQDHLISRGLNTPQVGGEILLIARLSENTPEETAGEATLLDVNIGTASPDGTALREKNSDDLLIVPSESLRDLLAGPEGCIPPSPSPSSTVIATPSPSPESKTKR